MPKLSTSLKTLSWAAYLACSWTWCIGMFLPILLLRDFGPWGFVVFAVPNVIGAAAMGFVLTRQQSRRIVETHKPVIVIFSLVTITYQAFLVGWLMFASPEREPIYVVSEYNFPLATLLFVALVLQLIGFFVAMLAAAFGSEKKSFKVVLVRYAPALFMFSLVLFVAIALLQSGAKQGGLYMTTPANLPVGDLIALMPITVFGFLLCPYLDATFHLASRASPHPRSSFGIGFGILFLVMILGTWLYANEWLATGTIALRFVLLHMALQLAFTAAVHGERVGSLTRNSMPIVLITIPLVGLVAGGFAEQTDLARNTLGVDLSTGELIYRLFLSFYGLIFPAYVYLCMIPTRDRHSGLAGPSGRRKLNTWLGVVAIAAPFFWMGFIERRELFLIPGLAIILLARLTLPGGWRLPKRATASEQPINSNPGNNEPRP